MNDMTADGRESLHLKKEAERPFPTDAEKQYPLAPSTIDASYYTDPDRFRREMSGIFHRTWLPIAPSADIGEPRDILVWDRLGQSIVVARLETGGLAAWHNVCQHRGARLVAATECGRRTNRLVCPWHGFQYDLEGKLRYAPLRESFDEALLHDLRAPPVRVAEWGGFVWICLSDEAPDLVPYLGAIGEELAFYGLEGFDVRYRFTLELNANWKMVVDAFNETWHVPFTHTRTLSKFVMWRDAHLRIADPHSWMTLPLKGFTDRMGDVDHRLKHICHYLAFPNTIFSCFPTHLQTWNIWPLSVDKTLFTAWGMVGPTPPGMSDEEWITKNDRDWASFCDVSSEDAAVLNDWGTVSQSLGAGRYMFNTAESRLTAFHREVARRTDG